MLATEGVKCVDPDKWVKWKKVIWQDSPNTKFFDDSLTLVKHLNCLKPFKVKHLYDLTH